MAVDLDFDDMLEYVGTFGRYQKCLFFWMAPFAIFVGFIYFSPYFITLVPDHWCDIPELEELSPEDR